MPDFEVKISTPADLTGADQAAGKLDNLKKSADSASDSIEGAGEKGKNAGKKIHDGAEHGAIGHRELRESVAAVGQQFGGLADVGLWLEPMTAALAVVLAAVDAIKRSFETFEEPVRQAAEALAKLDTTKLKSAADAASSLSASFTEIGNNQNNLQASFERGNTAMENRIKLYNEQRDGILKVQEAEEKAFEAALDHQVALGQKTKEQADEQKENARLGLEQSRDAGDAAKLQNEINERNSQVTAARGRLQTGADDRAIRKAAKEEAAAKAASDQAEQEKKNAEEQSFDISGLGSQGTNTETFKNLDEAKKEAAENREAAQNNEEQGDDVGAAQFRAEADKIESVIRGRQAYIDNLATLANKAKAKADEAANATKNKTEDEKHDQELNGTENAARIKALEDQLAILRQTAAGVARAHAATVNSQDQTEEIETWKRILEAIHGGHATPDQQNRWNQLSGAIGNHTATPEQRRIWAEINSALQSPQDNADQNRWSNTPTAGIDVNQGRAALGTAQAHVRSGQGNDEELRTLFNEFMGLARDIHANAAQRAEFNQLRQEVETLRSQVRNTRYPT